MSKNKYVATYILSNLSRMTETDKKCYIHNVKRHLVDDLMGKYPSDQYKLSFTIIPVYGELRKELINDRITELIRSGEIIYMYDVEKNIDSNFQVVTLTAEVPNEQSN